MICLTNPFGLQLIRRIDVPVRDIRWSDSGELVAIISEASFYILRLDSQAVNDFLASGEEAEDDGLEDAFELLNEVSERVRTGKLSFRSICLGMDPCLGGGGRGGTCSPNLVSCCVPVQASAYPILDILPSHSAMCQDQDTCCSIFPCCEQLSASRLQHCKIAIAA